MESFHEFLVSLGEKVSVIEKNPFTMLFWFEHKEKGFLFIQLENFDQKVHQNTMATMNNHFVSIVFEDVWFRNPDIVKSRILYQLVQSARIHGRDTRVEKVHRPVAEAFYKENHLSALVVPKHNYGLFIDNELVALSGFGKVLIMRSYKRSAELIRFCSLKGTYIAGGFTKLLMFAAQELKLREIMTYVDLEWSNGNGYKNLGFKEVATKGPITFIIDLRTMERTHYEYWKKLNPDAPLEAHYRLVNNAGSKKMILYL